MGLNPFKREPEVPIAVSVGEDESEEKAALYREFSTPEGFYEYQSLKIEPAAAMLWKDIFRDWQMGYYSKEDFQNMLFLFVLSIRCIKYKYTRDYGRRLLEKTAYYALSTNSKEGFLRKQEQTKTKETMIKQQKNWKERVKW
jgi:hypothetical protein